MQLPRLFIRSDALIKGEYLLLVSFWRQLGTPMCTFLPTLRLVCVEGTEQQRTLSPNVGLAELQHFG